MLKNVQLFCQSSIKISKNKIVYFDPFKINDEYYDADIIFITHDHYDHFDIDSINKIKKEDTIIVVPEIMHDQVKGIFNDDKIILVKPNNNYVINGLEVEVMPSYNINKQFHPKEKNYVGYIVTIENIKYYAMGDTDAIAEAKGAICDVLFIPIGGTYTMNYEEASILTNEMRPKVVVPIHYGTIVGTYNDGYLFKDKIDSDIECQILMKENE